MTMPTYMKTGKENALYSVYKHLDTYLTQAMPGVNVILSTYNQAALFPCVSVNDIGVPQLGDLALGRYLGKNSQGVEKYGRLEQTTIEINCMEQNDSARGVVNAEAISRRLRDLVKYIMQLSGVITALPVIKLIDSQNSDADTGAIVTHPGEESNTWTESFIENTSELPNVKRYRIYCRIQWLWYEE